MWNKYNSIFSELANLFQCFFKKISIKMEFNYFGSNLRYLRLKNGLTQTEFGSEIGLGKSRLSEIEAGDDPTFPILRKVAKYFKISLDLIVDKDLQNPIDDPPDKGKIGYDENYNDRPNGNHAPPTATRAIAMNALGVSTEGESPPTEEEENITAEELKQMRKFLKAIKIAETI
jgi:transcriptional regulator with XRE-family HTH domain